MSDEISIPWSASDVARAVRETLATTREVVSLFRYFHGLYDGRKTKRAAASLEALGFTPDGMRQPLKRIADGDFSHDDISKLSSMLRATADRVEKTGQS
jgi:hypothetical protein